MRTTTGDAARAARPRVRLTGPLREVRHGAPGGQPMVRADLGAEGGKVRLIWLGRDHIAGIEPGRVLAVEGTVSVRRGRATIYNPRYELRPDGGGQQDCLRPDGGGQQDC